MFDARTVRSWISQVAQLKSIKDQEMSTRKGLVKQYFGDVPKRGTSHALVAQDLKLTLLQDHSYTVKRDDIQQVMNQMTDADKEAIKWVPEVKPGAFRKLPADSVLRRIVRVKPSTPSLSVMDLSVK